MFIVTGHDSSYLHCGLLKEHRGFNSHERKEAASGGGNRSTRGVTSRTDYVVAEAAMAVFDTGNRAVDVFQIEGCVFEK